MILMVMLDAQTAALHAVRIVCAGMPLLFHFFCVQTIISSLIIYTYQILF
jgi:hypothetical protein